MIVACWAIAHCRSASVTGDSTSKPPVDAPGRPAAVVALARVLVEGDDARADVLAVRRVVVVLVVVLARVLSDDTRDVALVVPRLTVAAPQRELPPAAAVVVTGAFVTRPLDAADANEAGAVEAMADEPDLLPFFTPRC